MSVTFGTRGPELLSYVLFITFERYTCPFLDLRRVIELEWPRTITR